jgi:hypothetical protein
MIAFKELNPQILVIFATGYSNETAILADLEELGVAIDIANIPHTFYRQKMDEARWKFDGHVLAVQGKLCDG